MSSPIPLESLLPDRTSSSGGHPVNGNGPISNRNGSALNGSIRPVSNGKRPAHIDELVYHNGNGRGVAEIEVPIGPAMRLSPSFEDKLDAAEHVGEEGAAPEGVPARAAGVGYMAGDYNCNYGARSAYCERFPKPHEENSLEDFRLGAAKLSELGSLIVSLAGGEPMLRRDVHQIVDILARDHFPYLTTSGSGMTTKRARQLWEAGLWGCSVSIDYADPATCPGRWAVKFATNGR